MKKIRIILAIIVCKLLIMAGKLAGKKGSSTPGGIALKISPDVLKYLSKQVRREVIMVCGTNGKTTTNNLLYSLLKTQSDGVVCNNVGANMLPGVACAFIDKASVFGRLNADFAAIECDEASLRHIIKHVTPDKIVITNLFRDQLDRYGEIDITIHLLNEALEKLTDTTLILNADDPLCAQFGEGRKCLYYGVSENVNLTGNETKEGRFCLKCGNELTYSYYLYSQLGDYRCEKCGFCRPTPDYSASEVDLADGIAFTLDFGGKKMRFAVDYRGFYNIYNLLASFAAFDSVGGRTENAEKVFKNYKPQIGRMEPFKIKGKTVVLNLSKNPAGFNQAIATLCSDPKKKDVMIVLNDNAQDGRDVSWIWDVDYEKLAGANIASLTASGIRKYDMALRLKYAGFDNVKTADNTREVLLKTSQGEGEICYVLINYTALFDTQNNLRALEDK